MIKIKHDNDVTFTFGLRVNALNIELFLSYYKAPNINWTFYDAWPKIKREEIIIPPEVLEKAKAEAANLIIFKENKVCAAH
ncbi:MAG: hypothetical protein HAW67_07400 [Endozoicomonadaceae bacterium]|nr:hypothetical protein [Endozoicomonadaceae bacterium]